MLIQQTIRVIVLVCCGSFKVTHEPSSAIVVLITFMVVIITFIVISMMIVIGMMLFLRGQSRFDLC